MKIKAIILSLAVGATLLVGCGTKEPAKTAPTSTEVAKKEPVKEKAKTDVVATASVVDNQAAFKKAAGKDGVWLVSVTKDLKVDDEIVLEGEFLKADQKDATKKAPAREIALYNQDDKRVKTATYTLTSPKLTVKSENTLIKGGTFVGDVYVETKGFSIADGKVQGNVYFATQELKAAFKLGEGGSVTGATEVKK